MRLVTKLAAGLLLGIGLPITVLATAEIMDPNQSAQDREELRAALIFFGLPPLAIGGWLIAGAYQTHQKETRDRLQASFFQILKQNQGRITPLDLAMITGLSGEQAKTYLDTKAKEFGVTFDVDETGGIFYCFSLGQAKVSSLPSNDRNIEFTQVILESVAPNRKIDTIKVVRELTGLGLKEAKDLVEATPTSIHAQLSLGLAQQWQQQLEAVGATVVLR
jgi:large subunit ribosomal protein L7/L12